MDSENSSDIELGFDTGKQMVSKTVTFGDLPRPSRTLHKVCKQDLIFPKKSQKVKKSLKKKLVCSSRFRFDNGAETNK